MAKRKNCAFKILLISVLMILTASAVFLAQGCDDKGGKLACFYFVDGDESFEYYVGGGFISPPTEEKLKRYKSGYIYKGWATENGIYYTDDLWRSYTSKEDLWFSPVFEAIVYETYFIDFDGNTTTVSWTVESGETAREDIPKLNSERGYTVGWTEENEMHVAHKNVPLIDRKTYIANKVLNNYYINFKNVDLCTESSPKELKYTIESEYDLEAVAKEQLKRNGYDFDYWTVDDEKGARFTNIPKGTTGDMNLYAHWTLVKYTIEYSDCDGEDMSNAPTSYDYTQTADLPVLSREHYNFLGWKDEDGRNYTKIELNTYGNLKLKPFWSPIQYKITYSNNLDVTMRNLNPNRFSVETDITLEAPSADYCDFLYWAKGSAEGEQVTSITPGTNGDFKLVAIFKPQTFNITYTDVKDVDTSDYPDKYTYLEGIEKLPEPEVDGYTFDSWSYGGIKFTKISKEIGGDIEFSAVFIPLSYTVTLDAAGGFLNSTSATAKYERDFYLPVPERAGYDFVGWFVGSTQLTGEKGNSLNKYSVLDDVEAVAHWTLHRYTVTFDVDGGTDIEPIKVQRGDTFDMPVAVKSGKRFIGWFDADGKKMYGTHFTVEDDVTMYAKFGDFTPISDKSDFLKIKDDPSGNYYLTGDINMQGEQITPIGTFSGILDGNGKKIYNFTMQSSTDEVRKFAIINNLTGIVKSLYIDDCSYNINVSYDIGGGNPAYGILAATNAGTIYDCHILNAKFTASLLVRTRTEVARLNTYIGVMVGDNSGVMENCTAKSECNAVLRGYYLATFNMPIFRYYFGGLAGCSYSEMTGCGATPIIRIQSGWEECYININNDHYEMHTDVGGLVGAAFGGSKSVDCYANSEITYLKSASYYGSSASYINVGGLVGEANAKAKLSASYADSSVRVEGGAAATMSVGGFVGASQAESQVLGCYADTDIYDNCGTGVIGGFVGNGMGTVQNCYAKGAVRANASGKVGGFVGYIYRTGTITKNYSCTNVYSANAISGFFTAGCEGISSKNYFDQDIIHIKGGKEVLTPENADVKGLEKSRLWSKELLVDTLYWNDEGWIILTDQDPLLKWETTPVGGHNYQKRVVEPTCSDGGFTVYTCTDASCPHRTFISDFVAPLEHKWELVKVFPSTCTEEGYGYYHCEVCGEFGKFDFTDALGHMGTDVGDEQQINDAIAADNTLSRPRGASCQEYGIALKYCDRCETYYNEEIEKTEHSPIPTQAIEWVKCTADGVMSGTVCEHCGEVLTEGRVIPAHDYKLKETVNEPTCTEEGYAIYVCSACETEEIRIIPPKGHTDADIDGICDIETCRALVFTAADISTFIHISDETGLRNIAKNLSERYVLDCDITLSAEWTPIGSEARPFIGIFYGQGHKIIGLKISALSNVAVNKAQSYGMFACVGKGGIVCNTVLQDPIMSFGNRSLTAGTIVGANNGNVIGCKVINAEISVDIDITLSELSYVKYDFSTAIGTLVGVNGAEGIVANCVVEGEVNLIIRHQNDISTNDVGDALISLIRKASIETALNVTFGGIAGDSDGSVSGCNSSAKYKVTAITVADLGAMRGKAYAYTYIVCGEVVGMSKENGDNVSTEIEKVIPLGTKAHYSSSGSIYKIEYATYFLEKGASQMQRFTSPNGGKRRR